MNMMDYTINYTSPKSSKVGYAVLGLACVVTQCCQGISVIGTNRILEVVDVLIAEYERLKAQLE